MTPQDDRVNTKGLSSFSSIWIITPQDSLLQAPAEFSAA